MEYKLYNGDITLHFDEKKHLYTVGPQKVDGVTSILGIIAKPALMYWAVNQAIDHLDRNIRPGVEYDEIQLQKLLEEAKYAHRKRSSEASNIGKIVHTWCENWIAGKKPKLPIHVKARNACEQFLKWVEKNDIEFLHSERVVYSREGNYAGTTDFIMKTNDRIYLGDFKTSNAIYDEYFFQTAAYQQAYLEEFPDEQIEGNIVVRLSKTGDFEIRENYDYLGNVEAFNAALTLFRRVNKLDKLEVKKEDVMQKLMI